MNVKFLMAFLIICATGFSQSKGTITGTLTDKDFNNETLPFANAVVKGTTIGTTTDESGKYTLMVDPGTYTIQFSFLGYETVEEMLTIAAGETVVVNKVLGAGSYTLQDVVVQAVGNRERETALLLEQKNAVEIKQSIGAQEMSRKGISTVEEGLTKITGISKVESRGLFIRGLEDRYNNLLVNGFAMPSNSPFKKILPLDLFPTDVVGHLDIYKTFNADLYADFGGATINVNTSQPGKSRTKVSFGAGYTTKNNLGKFLIASDANNSKSFFGYGGKDRELPAAFGSVPSGKTSNEFSSGWNVDETVAPLNSSFGVTHTGYFNIGKNQNKFSYLLATNFENEYKIRHGVDRIFSQGQGNYDNNLRRSQYRYQTTSSTLIGLQYKTNRANLAFNTMYLKSTENMIQDQIGYTRTAVQNPKEIIRLNQYEQSDYINGQLYGDYALTEDKKHTIRGGFSYTKTMFTQPDRKFINGTVIDDTYIETTYGGNHLIRQYLDVDGNFFLSGLLEYNLELGKAEASKPHKLTVGYNGYANQMESTYRFVFGKPNGSNTVTVPLNNIDASLQEHIESNFFSFREESNGDFNTKIMQNIHAAYVNAFFALGKFEVTAGIRAESTIRETKYRDVGASFDDSFKVTEVNEMDILPALNLKYPLNDNSNLRLATSKTLTRPVLIETLPTPYINADGTSERGKADLQNSENFNADLKYEFFPTPKEMIAATVFGKYINKPIERTIESSGTGSGQTITYFNNKNAQLLGVELEFLLQLNRMGSMFDNFSLGFNTTLMYTNSEVDKNRPGYFDTFEERNLQGASNWLINSDLKYEFDLSKTWQNSVSVVYNVYGERIYAVGIADLDHIYERPFHKLDFIWTSNLSEAWELKFAVDNILNPVYRKELGSDNRIDIYEPSLTLEDYQRGVGYSVKLSYTF
ncbi:MAG: TonB-dependent receptor [Flavobacterium sp.]|nr:TonB-dependent receptor [Flavobacterium sp.]